MASPLRWALGFVLLGAGSAGCERAPANEICPRVEAGELVISELRGGQDGQDSFSHYVEVYNGSGRALDLQGMWIRISAVDGEEKAIFVRDEIEVAAGGYAVIGSGHETLPSWLDYGTGSDISGDLLDFRSGFVVLESCDSLIDEVFYPLDSLPTLGTVACGGATTPPDAGQNDEVGAGCWCVDAEESDVPLPGLGLPGTPGRANRCP